MVYSDSGKRDSNKGAGDREHTRYRQAIVDRCKLARQSRGVCICQSIIGKYHQPCIGRSNLRFSPSQTVPGWVFPAPRPAAGPCPGIRKAVTSVLHSPCFAWVPAQAVFGLGVRQGKGSPNLCLTCLTHRTFGPCSPIRRVLHDGQTPRPLQEKAVRKLCPHSSRNSLG
jgi:hypothetical protein